MVPFIDSDKTRQLAHHHMVGLLNGNDPRKAARYAETVRASEEWEWAAQELLAVALIDSGTRTVSAADLQRGIDILERAPHADSPMTRYNVANGRLSLWEIASRPEQYVAALRHGFVTAALDAGVSLRDVQDAAGHADPRTTRRYDRGRHSLDRAATYAVAQYVAV